MLVRADKKWDYAIGMIKVDGPEPAEAVPGDISVAYSDCFDIAK